MHFLLRKRIPHPNVPGMVQYQTGDTFTPGIENIVPELMVGNPQLLMKGPGILVGQMAVVQPPQVYQTLALPTMPLQGTPVGMYSFDGLTDSPEPTQ